MATVFMRWLERHPAMYDRGIRLLTLSQLDPLYDIIAMHVNTGMQVLEIGCGTGNLTTRIAERGASITAVDVSADMLEAARIKLQRAALLDRVRLSRMDATALDTHFKPASFDLIVSSLAFSELSPSAQSYVLRLCRQLLKADGALWILDEIQSPSIARRMLASLVRAPLKLITWLLTRTTTHPLKRFDDKFDQAGFDVEWVADAPMASLAQARAGPSAAFSPEIDPSRRPQLKHRSTLATLMRDLWALFFRILPPYPKIEPGLYAVGTPGPSDPFLVTGNYDLTVRRLVKALDGGVTCWLLVVDSAGINVWCGAGGGFLNAERVIGALKMSGADAWHTQKAMVLPQLCANGVDGNVIREETGWRVRWGPVRASDVPAYLGGDYEKTEDMRTVRFPLLDRLEMVSATLGLYALMIMVPVLIFWRHAFWPVLLALLGLSYFYALALPLIPGRDGLAKSLPLGMIALTGMLIFSWFTGFPAAPQLFRRGVGMIALSVFVAAELQGMSPLMRGEQANWGWEAVIAVVLAGLYWLVPRLVGWSF